MNTALPDTTAAVPSADEAAAAKGQLQKGEGLARSGERAKSDKTQNHRNMAKGNSERTAVTALTAVGSKTDSQEDDEDDDDDDEEDEEDAPAPTSMAGTNQLQLVAPLSNAPDTLRLPPKRRKRGEDDVPMTFPQRLMEILDNDQNRDIIAWLPHGRGFMIFQKKRFAAELMPTVFKKSKFTSFTRKLNRWNFTRVTRGPETGAYYHDYFHRANLRLCMQMSCQNSKSGGGGMDTSSGLGRSSVGDAMNRLQIAAAQVGGGGGSAPSQIPSLSSVLQGQLGGGTCGGGGTAPQIPSLTSVLQGQLSGLHSGSLAEAIGGVQESEILKLRQLEQQRELMLQQQQLQQQQHQQQLQQQQLAAMGALNRQQQQQRLLSGSSPAGGPDMSLGALQRSNANAYLAMIMAQEKVQAQMAALGGGPNNIPSPLDLQRQQQQLLQAQQQQMEMLQQQRLRQLASGSKPEHAFMDGAPGPGATANNNDPGSPSVDESVRKVKRASAA